MSAHDIKYSREHKAPRRLSRLSEAELEIVKDAVFAALLRLEKDLHVVGLVQTRFVDETARAQSATDEVVF